MDTRKPITLPNGGKFKPKYYVNCRTPGVVYLISCECGCFYVGKTKLEFWHRIYHHIVSIGKKNLGRLSSLVHGDTTPKVKFLALDHIYANPRGGDFNTFLLQSELYWIFHLKREVWDFPPIIILI